MIKIKFYPLLQRATLIMIAAVCMITTFALMQPTTVNAQASQQPRIDLNKEAEEFCKKEKTDDTKAACRNGFRHGHTGDENQERACINRVPFYNNAEKEACKRGYSKGKALRTTGPSASSGTTTSFFGDSTGSYQCGSGANAIKTRINFGCVGADYEAQGKKINPIFDVTFAIIRFLTYGIGIIIVIAIIMAGIKYTTSEGNPEATIAAKNQIQNAVIALMLYIFAFALLNFLVPGGVFR